MDALLFAEMDERSLCGIPSHYRAATAHKLPEPQVTNSLIDKISVGDHFKKLSPVGEDCLLPAESH